MLVLLDDAAAEFEAASVTELDEVCLPSMSFCERMASAWIGMLNTSFFCAVWILAVTESPGRRPVGGLSSVTTTLKSRASWVLVVVWVIEASPVLRRMA